MKKALLGLVALVASSCLKPIDERAIDIVIKECNTISGASILNLDLPVDNEYLTLEQIARIGKTLEDTTDCHLTVYLKKVSGERLYIVQKNTSVIKMFSIQDTRFEKLYPVHK